MTKFNDEELDGYLAIENEYVAFHKPSGMHSHAQKPTEMGTALQRIEEQFPECGDTADFAKPLEGLLVHRLDQGTSGILICARTPKSWSSLRKAWSEKSEVEKVYLAWVEGEMECQGELHLPICHDPKSKKKMALQLPLVSRMTKAEKGIPAHTAFRPILHDEGRTLVLIRIFTGVMHQIRVSLSALGHPVSGDFLYAKTRAAQSDAVQGSLSAIDPKTEEIFDLLEKKLLEDQVNIEELLRKKTTKFSLHALWLRVPKAKGKLASGIFCPL